MEIKDIIDAHDIEFYYIDDAHESIKLHYDDSTYETIPYTEENLKLVVAKLYREYEEYVMGFDYYEKKLRKYRILHKVLPLITCLICGSASSLLFYKVLYPSLFTMGGILNIGIVSVLDLIGLGFASIFISEWCAGTIEVFIDQYEGIVDAVENNVTFKRIEKSVLEKLAPKEEAHPSEIKEKISEILEFESSFEKNSVQNENVKTLMLKRK